MEFFKKFGVVTGILAIAVILAILRITGTRFKPDAVKWAEPSFDRSNILSSVPGDFMKKDFLIIYLDETSQSEKSPNTVNLMPSEVINDANIKRIKENEGPVVLYSEDPAVSSSVWMLLSQTGIKNLFILSDRNDEIRKNEFRPDTVVLPEL
jgi:hypothetical protein